MEISEVRIKLMENSQERLLAFCSITIERSFVVRDVKIIKGTRGPFVAMPSRKLCDRCPGCGCKNHLRAAFCSQCGKRLNDDRSLKDPDGRAKLYADIAHPIHSECRDKIQHHVLAAYQEELVLAQKPGYVCRYDDYGEDGGDYDEVTRWDEPAAASTGGSHRRVDAPAPAQEGPHVTHEDHGSRIAPVRRADEFGDGVF